MSKNNPADIYSSVPCQRSIPLMVLGQKPPDKKPPDKSLPDKSRPTISLQYKNPNKTGARFFLGLVDPSRSRLASTAYFAIISSIILWCLLSGGFCPGGLCPGGFLSGLLTGYPAGIYSDISCQRSIPLLSILLCLVKEVSRYLFFCIL